MLLDTYTSPTVLALVGMCAACWIVMFAVRGRFIRLRRQSARSYAARHGYRFSADDPYRLTDTGLPLLRRGRRRRCGNVISGQRHGLSFVAADYMYNEHEFDARGDFRGYPHTYKLFAIAVVALHPQLRLPPMIIARRIVPTPAGDHVGLSEVRTGYEPFDRRFRVEVGGGRMPGQVIHAPMMRHLLELPTETPVFRWELAGSRLMVVSAPRTMPMTVNQPMENMLMEFIEPLLAAARDFARQIGAAPPPVGRPLHVQGHRP